MSLASQRLLPGTLEVDGHDSDPEKERVGLHLDDLDSEAELVCLRGKGRRERLSPIGPLVVAAPADRFAATRPPRAQERLQPAHPAA